MNMDQEEKRKKTEDKKEDREEKGIKSKRKRNDREEKEK